MDSGNATTPTWSTAARCATMPSGMPRRTVDLDSYGYAALAAGAGGFLLKDVTPAHLAAAVWLVDTGDALLAPSITRRLVERFAFGTASAPSTPAVHRDLAVLTPREREVLTFSEATVKTHAYETGWSPPDRRTICVPRPADTSAGSNGGTVRHTLTQCSTCPLWSNAW